eukprot:CAMPEP_0172689064 /NCGR_PEP_ID=MMETSP1074-20121228/22884_1 /TAXON_ID=2916 /ORGANISM="Ceratium fusus, Strain PA161109" /LENGTH=353 /DNA_ID=CAMNT_0013508821 /DNA_START=64 /DNA_END=1125 /DNA_ORIENTATION=-
MVIKEAVSSSTHHKAPELNFAHTDTGSFIGWSMTDATTLPSRLVFNKSMGRLGLTSLLQNVHGLDFIASKSKDMVLDSWLPHGHSSVQQVVGHVVGMPLPHLFSRVRSLALLQTLHGQRTASSSATEPDVVIISPTGSANERLKQQFVDEYTPVLMMLISSLITLALAFLYWRHRKPPEFQQDAVRDEGSLKVWRFGLFSCFSDLEICLWACCCPAIRWADTVRCVGLLGFWMAFAIFFSMEVVASNTGQIIIWAVLALLCAAMRQEMRKAYGMHEQGGWTYFEDFCLYCCCACCTIIQEARQVEEAYKVGYPIEVRPSWDQGAAPAAAHVQGVPAHQAPAARMQEGNGNDHP